MNPEITTIEPDASHLPAAPSQPTKSRSKKNPAIRYLNLSQLKKRRWTPAMITTLLGEPDLLKQNPKYRSSYPMRLYRERRVLRAEKSKKFNAWQARTEASRAKIKAASLAAAESRRQELLANIEALEIKVSIYSMPKLRAMAIASYNSRNAERSSNYVSATETSSDEFLERIMVNFLRHECSHYEALLDATFGKTGRDEAVSLVRDRVLDKIAETYPELSSECFRQSLRAASHVWP